MARIQVRSLNAETNGLVGWIDTSENANQIREGQSAQYLYIDPEGNDNFGLTSKWETIAHEIEVDPLSFLDSDENILYVDSEEVLKEYNSIEVIGTGEKLLERMTVGTKKDAGKPRMDLVPARADLAMGKIFGFGAEKYDEGDSIYGNNWRQGMRWGRVIASLKRHIAKFELGEDYDDETGELHMAHVLCNAAMLHEFYSIFPQGDDRAVYWRKEFKIGLDVDGVICDLYPEIMRREGATEMNHYAWSPEQLDILRAMTREEMLAVEPMIHGSQLKFEPACYITARYGDHFDVVAEWLHKWGFPYAPVYSVDGSSKAEKVVELGLDIFVEDKFKTMQAIQNAGVACYLIDQPYNQKHDVGHFRISSVNDLPFLNHGI